MFISILLVLIIYFVRQWWKNKFDRFHKVSEVTKHKDGLIYGFLHTKYDGKYLKFLQLFRLNQFENLF